MCGVARTRALRCTGTPGGETPGCPGRSGNAAKGDRGTWEIEGSKLSACGWWLLLECLSSLVPFPSWGRAPVFVHLRTTYCVAPPVQLSLQEAIMHATGLSLFEASSNTWHVCDLLSH